MNTGAVMNTDGSVVADSAVIRYVKSQPAPDRVEVEIRPAKKPLSDDAIPISEIFVTIQGEGPYIGLPAVFVRVWGCNLACPTCDAWYTVPRLLAERGIKSEFEMMSGSQIIRKVRELLDEYPSITHLVITGGEPLLYQDRWIKFLGEFVLMELDIEWETNGTIIPTSAIEQITECFDVSPKLSTFGGISEIERIVDDALKWHNSNTKSWFKFVVASNVDVKELNELVKRLRLNAKRVMLMPEGDTNEEIKRTGLICADAAKRYGWRMTWRLQTPLWGTMRMT